MLLRVPSLPVARRSPLGTTHAPRKDVTAASIDPPSSPPTPALPLTSARLRARLPSCLHSSVLRKKYEFDADIALPFASLLSPMLELVPASRASARMLLHHPYITSDEMHAEALRKLGEQPPAPIPASWTADAADATGAAIAALDIGEASEPPSPVVDAPVDEPPKSAPPKSTPPPKSKSAPKASQPTGGALAASSSSISSTATKATAPTIGPSGFALVDAATVAAAAADASSSRQPSRPVRAATGRVFHASTGADGPGAIVAYYRY